MKYLYLLNIADSDESNNWNDNDWLLICASNKEKAIEIAKSISNSCYYIPTIKSFEEIGKANEFVEEGIIIADIFQ